jgi:hypothetical protein
MGGIMTIVMRFLVMLTMITMLTVMGMVMP